MPGAIVNFCLTSCFIPAVLLIAHSVILPNSVKIS